MKKKWIVSVLILSLLTSSLFFAHAKEDGANTAEFDDAVVLAVTKPADSGIRLSSLSGVTLDKLGIAKVEDLDASSDAASPAGISLFGVSGEERTLQLTLKQPGRENVLKTVESLNALPEIEFAQPNYIYHLMDLPDDPVSDDPVPNDPEYASDKQYGLDMISAPEVWGMDIDCSGVTVAVIDTGVTLNHPDLADNLGRTDDVNADGNGRADDVYGWNFIANNNNPDDDAVSTGAGDPGFHGSHVSGIISAVTDNGTGIASLARNARIVSLKVYDAAKRQITTTSLYKAMKYVKSTPQITIVNNSYGFTVNEPDADSLIKNKIGECSDVLFVAAAGNGVRGLDRNLHGVDNDVTPTFPASYDFSNILSVAATNQRDELTYYSNYGKKSVDLAAPGDDIYSTIRDGYAYLSGTSQATPMVTGAAAVLKAKYPDMTPEELISQLVNNSDRLDSLKGKIKSGGRLNAYKALMRITLSQTSASMKAGEELQLTSSFSPENIPAQAEWHSDNPDVASVENGLVTAHKLGTATVTVTYGDAAFGEVSKSCSVTVFEPAQDSALAAALTACRVVRDGDQISLSAEFSNDVQGDALFFASARRDQEDKKFEAAQIENGTAVLTIPEEIADGDITLYLWNKNCTPYMCALPMGGQAEPLPAP